ncbi:pilus assembly protein PilY [Alteromonas sediminis]|uniref:Pilus assembly protein PilY n=1 Tax=Alteromonas sediminis TaxID=2259342 RepID=A0A3N5YKV5_9ALTE|nr:PilC/PilY family type IV pilus protein [Alteromonas sediminis]RPJ65621.1 pilus assembly protein PilY [Alteromonas sediminis]
MKSSRLSFVTALILSSCVTMTAWGDDLEIYLGNYDEAKIFPPNVLFIMDTSGSMTNKDGGTESRMLRVQNALTEVLSTTTNINAGLMRFSDYGGPILYPVANIDIAYNSELIYTTSESANDAHEINGSVNITDTEVVLTKGTSAVHSGYRFEDIDIPQGAVVKSAYLRFTSAQLDISNADLDFYGELEPDSTAFTTSASDISSRTKTAASVSWTSEYDFPISGEQLKTPDITPIIQEIIDQEDWCGGNALNVILKGVGASAASSKRVNSADEGTGGFPQLIVSYDDTTATGCIKRKEVYQINSNNNNVEERSNGKDATGSELTFHDDSNDYVAIRFDSVLIPNSAEVSTAKLVFTPYRSSGNETASMNISAINLDDFDDFKPHKNFMIRNIAKTASINMSMPQQSKNVEYTSPELKTLVQSVVNRSGWTPGNAMGFVMSDFVGFRGAYSYKGKPSGSVRLVVEYTGNAVPNSSLTVRDYLIGQVDQLTANGYTPIVDTLYEAANYYAGNDVLYGLERGPSNVPSSVRRSTRVSHPASYIGSPSVRPTGCDEANLSASDCVNEYIPDGATYISPISDFQCQTNNHIVLLSDGAANNNHSAGLVRDLLGIDSCEDSGGDACGVELVRNLANNEESVVGTKVYTHTIGFAANAEVNNFLNKLAVQGDGGFYTADNSENLVEAFNSILKTVKDVNTTFVSPGVAVNQLNRLTHRDDLYFALFKPAEGTVWPGNLKKFKLGGSQIKDKNGQPAVDSASGFFKDTAHSYWSVLQDGSNVEEGGAASRLTTSRNVYVFDSPGTITTSSNKLHEDNSNITAAMLSLQDAGSPEEMRELVLKWARGIDVRDEDGDSDYTDARQAMGDPIHAQPAVVDYSLTDSAIFVATNQGFLHSIDAETGSENFAIIPQDLLPNLSSFYEDSSTFSHVYGLDGDLVLRTVGNKTYLYVGMRRGGRNYYVFDVSNKTAPSLLYSIKGGTEGLERLGQTWSKPTITKVKMGGSVKNVMIVGGGYDDAQDDKSVRSPDAFGNAVYMFDADSGDLLWTASSDGADVNIADMQYGIPGRVSAIDRDADGLIDHMYVGDMGGQLFRFDIYNGESGDDFIKGAKIADFGGDNEEDNRRFYYGPDVSEVALGSDLYYAVAIGSGKRASPLDTVINDRFYMYRDASVFSLESDGTYSFPSVATEDDLYDATAHLLTSSDETEKGVENSAFATKSGWKIHLTTSGEKVLSSPLIIDYKIFFTTYVPAASSDGSCAPPSGTSRAYLVNLLDGNAVDDLNNDDTLAANDRVVELKLPGIPPDPRVFITDPTNPVVCLGTECAATTINVAEPCTSAFECLAENIYGEFERVKRSSWRTESEGDD